MRHTIASRLVDQHVTKLLCLMVDGGVPVSAVLAGAWAAVNRKMIDQFGADIAAGEHDTMARTIRGHLRTSSGRSGGLTEDGSK